MGEEGVADLQGLIGNDVLSARLLPLAANGDPVSVADDDDVERFSNPGRYLGADSIRRYEGGVDVVVEEEATRKGTRERGDRWRLAFSLQHDLFRGLESDVRDVSVLVQRSQGLAGRAGCCLLGGLGAGGSRSRGLSRR